MSYIKTLEDAILLAAELHKGQIDKQGQPYILHVLRVMLSQRDPLCQMVGVMHDLVEDTWLTLDQIAMAGYPPVAVAALDALTRRKDEDYPDYIQRVMKNDIARAVKIGDLQDHLSRIQQLSLADQNRLLPRYTSAMVQLTAGRKDKTD